jgi:hypothetical protein
MEKSMNQKGEKNRRHTTNRNPNARNQINLGRVGPAERLDANKAKIGNEEQHTS